MCLVHFIKQVTNDYILSNRRSSIAYIISQKIMQILNRVEWKQFYRMFLKYPHIMPMFYIAEQ